jgi:hypothetical protein
MMMTDEWLAWANADADRRGLPELKPLLSALATATRALRAADWNEDARQGPRPAAPRAADAGTGERATDETGGRA